MRKLLPLIASFVSLVVAISVAPAQTTQPAVASTQTALTTANFLRFVDRGDAGGRLETADVTFKNADGAAVHLVAAVHIAERSYFEALNENFKARDVVLYELVKPRDAAMNAAPAESHSGVSEFQRFLKDSLNLEFQLDVIDYSAPNFVHADLDAETFAQKQAERGESFMTLMLQQMMRAMSQPPPKLQQDPQELAQQQMDELIKMVCRPDHERQLKLLVAKHMADVEDAAMGLDGPGGSAILTDRNEAAIAKLKETLASGKKDIAIFYGAAHMPDLSKRLAAMGFKPLATDWRMAWDLSIRSTEPSAVEQVLRDLLRGLDQQ
jgi:hypothetical protein